MDEQIQERLVGWFLRTFLVALVVWLAAAALLGIPHGVGHPIESMTPVQTIHDISQPIWIGSFVGIIALLGVKTFGALRRSNS